MLVESNNIQDYYKKSNVIDFDNKIIINKCLELKKGINDELEIIKTVYEFVRDKISHLGDVNGQEIPCSASEVLSFGYGICCAKAHLLAAMLRYLNIPTGFCYQLITPVNDKGKMYIHGLNAVYIKGLDKWVRLDAEGNKNRLGAQFSIDEEKLAWPIRPELGEKHVDTIFAEPNARVVEVLMKYENREEYRKHYQTDLEGLFN